MKIFFLIIIGLYSLDLIAQPDHVSNSFKKIYDTRFPQLKYSYDPAAQTHNYSGNWDIDGDNDPDSLFFIGNGGAHLYFHLRIKLSSEAKTRDFKYLVTDFPVLDSIDHFKMAYGKSQFYPVFVMHDFNKDEKTDIYINTDIRFTPIPANWKRRGITSRNLVIFYEKKNLVIKNFPGFQN